VQNGWTDDADLDNVNINVVNIQNKPKKKSKRTAVSVAEQADVSSVQSPAKKRKVDCSDESIGIAESDVKSRSSTSEEKKKKKKKKAAGTENSDSLVGGSNSNDDTQVQHCASEKQTRKTVNRQHQITLQNTTNSSQHQKLLMGHLRITEFQPSSVKN
jgi:hypothetical protein